MRFKRLDVSKELQELGATPPKAAKPPKVESQVSLSPAETTGQASPYSQLRELYRQTAEIIAEDCGSLPPMWLLDHPEFYQRIKALDDQLSEMERMDAGELEYQSTLARLMRCVRDTRAAFERESEESEWRLVQ